jgi:hypothetical protein
LCISPRSAGQEIETGQAKRSVAILKTVYATFKDFTASSFPWVPFLDITKVWEPETYGPVPPISKVMYFRITAFPEDK